MRSTPWILVSGLLILPACGGTSSTESNEVDAAVTEAPASARSAQAPETLPALVDPSTDIDAIDKPVVLWFWSPG